MPQFVLASQLSSLTVSLFHALAEHSVLHGGFIWKALIYCSFMCLADLLITQHSIFTVTVDIEDALEFHAWVQLAVALYACSPGHVLYSTGVYRLALSP